MGVDAGCCAAPREGILGSDISQHLSAQGFMPHGTCYLWQPGILSLHVVSDGIIALAYCSIPLTLLQFYRKRADLRFQWMFLCFAMFIIACGATHILSIWTVWYPAYWLSGSVKAVTAVASAATAALLVRILPDALRLPSPQALQRANLALEQEIAERSRMERDLRKANELLEVRVAERTADLETLNRILIQDNARFAIAADAAGLGFWSRDIAGNTLQWDERMARLHGITPGETDLPYATWLDSTHPEDRERFERESNQALAAKGEYDTEYRILRPSGAVRTLRTAARITRDSRGRAIRMFGVSFDITDLKRADEQFRLAIEAAPTGMLLMGVNGSIVLVNAQIENLFGYSRSELLGRSVEMLVPERFRAHHPDFRQQFFASPKARPMGAGRDLYGLRKDGAEVPIEIGLTPLHTSAGDFVLSSIVDLSLRREMDRMTKDFVSMVSHELRTPLTSINGSLGLLQTGALGALPEQAAGMVQIAAKNSTRLVRIVNDILDIGKLDAGELTIQKVPVALADLLRQSVEANSSYAEQYGVNFRLEEGPASDYVMGDPDRIMQVVANLLSNAAKFSAPGADVHIRVRPNGASMRVEIEDSGPGIPEAFKDRVFQKFAQADTSASRRVMGTGLGLSIARRLIEAMGGTIGFSSVTGQGTTFFLDLPRPSA
jgi:PAS domain S-box-containing protein